MDSLSITIRLEAVGSVKGPASDLKSAPQVIPVVDTVEEVDEGSTTNSKGKRYNVEGSIPPVPEGLVGDEEPQEIGGRAIPVSDGPHVHSGQDKLALEAPECLGRSPKSPTGVIGMPDGR